MANVKYQVFISSTFRDLEKERRIVMEQILNLRHIPVGMELFQAADEAQWNYIKKRILECDYYVVIVAERYGAEGPDGKSYTQMEYEFAVANGIPVVAFLLHDDARRTWPREHVEFDKLDKIAEFRRQCETRLVKHWRNGDELGTKVVLTLVEMMESTPRVGWVRADAVAPDAALSEIAKLSEEKRTLQERLSQLEASSDLKPPADVAYRLDVLSKIKAADVMGVRLADEKFNNISLLDVFIGTFRGFAVGSSIWDAHGALVEFLGLANNVYSGEPSKILAEFAAHNLIATTYVQTTRFEELKSDVYYLLTEYGKQFALYAQMRMPTEIKGGEAPSKLSALDAALGVARR
jgi:hypothetical protein